MEKKNIMLAFFLTDYELSGPEPEPGQSDGAGSSQIPRLRAAPAPKPWFSYSFKVYSFLSDKLLLMQLSKA